MRVSREQVLRYRVHAQQLDRAGSHGDAAVLDLGVQDTGPDGAPWALAVRGARIEPDALVYVWTLRGAPHAYRRSEAAGVAAATWPWSDHDAAKRTLDAVRPLRAAGVEMLAGMEQVTEAMRAIVTAPMAKGEVSGALTSRLPEPFLRECRPCATTHVYEQTFRLAALHAGLELEPGTSPPVLRPIPGWSGPAAEVPPRLDPVRAVLHLLGPADARLVAGYVDTARTEVAARWPDDVELVEVDRADGSPAPGRLEVLADDVDLLADPPRADVVRLLGPFDLFLQARDRELVVPDPAARKDLWRTLGRPGAVLADGEVVGSWRPRSAGRKLRLAVTVWDGSAPPAGLDDQAEHLAAFRGQTFAGYVDA